MSVEDQFMDEIRSHFLDTEEYGDFVVADRFFRSVDPDKFLDENANKNTKKKTDSDIRLFTAFLMSKNEPRNPEYIPPDELNNYLSQFILGVTKKDGSEYEPTTIRGFISSVDRHLKIKNSKMSIFNDIDFAKTRAVLKRKQQQLKGMGLGNKPRAAENLTEDHIYTMVEAGTLGDKTPRSLIHSMWLMCTSYFGMRTGKECHDLCWGDIHTEIDERSGEEYVVYDKERQTKTRSGSNPRDTRVLKPRAYANPGNKQRDPVYLYKLYSSKRPEDMCEVQSPFFLTPATVTHKNCWFKRSPMGINMLYNIMKDMKEGAGIQNPRITPYSSRKRLIQTLQDQGVPANQIVQISGHKNVNSINNYSRINNEQAKEISSILSNKQSNELQPVDQARSGLTMLDDKPFQGAFPQSLFPNCNFHGPVTVNFNNTKSETQTLSQIPTIVNNCEMRPVTDPNLSPIGRPFKRIRRISFSDSD